MWGRGARCGCVCVTPGKGHGLFLAVAMAHKFLTERLATRIRMSQPCCPLASAPSHPTQAIHHHNPGPSHRPPINKNSSPNHNRTLPLAESVILTLTFPLEDDPALAATVLLKWQTEYLDKEPMALTCNPVMPQDPATLAVLLTLFCMYAGEGPAAEAEALALLQPLADLGATNVTAQRMGLNGMPPAYDAATGGHLGGVLAAAAASGQPPTWECVFLRAGSRCLHACNACGLGKTKGGYGVSSGGQVWQ